MIDVTDTVDIKASKEQAQAAIDLIVPAVSVLLLKNGMSLSSSYDDKSGVLSVALLNVKAHRI